jgi:hypothetical protein
MGKIWYVRGNHVIDDVSCLLLTEWAGFINFAVFSTKTHFGSIKPAYLIIMALEISARVLGPRLPQRTKPCDSIQEQPKPESQTVK